MGAWVRGCVGAWLRGCVRVGVCGHGVRWLGGLRKTSWNLNQLVWRRLVTQAAFLQLSPILKQYNEPLRPSFHLLERLFSFPSLCPASRYGGPDHWDSAWEPGCADLVFDVGGNHKGRVITLSTWQHGKLDLSGSTVFFSLGKPGCPVHGQEGVLGRILFPSPLEGTLEGVNIRVPCRVPAAQNTAAVGGSRENTPKKAMSKSPKDLCRVFCLFCFNGTPEAPRWLLLRQPTGNQF